MSARHFELMQISSGCQLYRAWQPSYFFLLTLVNIKVQKRSTSNQTTYCREYYSLCLLYEYNFNNLKGPSLIYANYQRLPAAAVLATQSFFFINYVKVNITI